MCIALCTAEHFQFAEPVESERKFKYSLRIICTVVRNKPFHIACRGAQLHKKGAPTLYLANILQNPHDIKEFLVCRETYPSVRELSGVLNRDVTPISDMYKVPRLVYSFASVGSRISQTGASTAGFGTRFLREIGPRGGIYPYHYPWIRQ